MTSVKYFTSRVTNNIEKKLRQNEYLRALSTVEGIEIIYGKFQQAKVRCGICGQESTIYNEKMTDVNIATHMSADYFQDKFDAAMVISGDADLIPPIRLINEGELNKRAFVAFPPNRVNDEVRKFSKGDFVIGRKKLADSQFANEIILDEDEKICCPGTWTHLQQN